MLILHLCTHYIVSCAAGLEKVCINLGTVNMYHYICSSHFKQIDRNVWLLNLLFFFFFLVRRGYHIHRKIENVCHLIPSSYFSICSVLPNCSYPCTSVLYWDQFGLQRHSSVTFKVPWSRIMRSARDFAPGSPQTFGVTIIRPCPTQSQTALLTHRSRLSETSISSARFWFQYLDLGILTLKYSVIIPQTVASQLSTYIKWLHLHFVSYWAGL